MSNKFKRAGLAVLALTALGVIFLPAAKKPGGAIPTPAGTGGQETAMCNEHGVPEALCTKCNPALIPNFKAKGDWCAGHNLPESQCAICNPALNKPKAGPETAGNESDDLEKKTCNHNKRTVDCDNCRFELGMVKIEPSVSKALISTGTAQERPAVETLQVTGEVRFDETRVVDVPPAASGRVIRVYAFLGQPVKAGDTLVAIQSPDFGEAKAAYLKAYTAWEIAHREQERQAAVSRAVEKVLAILPKGADINWEGEDLMGEWKSKLGAALARLKSARLTYAREKSLWEKQISSRSDYESAGQELETAQADYAALIEELQLNLRVDKLRADNAVKSAGGELDAAGQRLHNFGLNGAGMGRLVQEKSDGRFAELVVKAPRSGTITAQNVSEGKLADAAQSLYTIADLSNLWVWCDVYEKDMAVLHDRIYQGNPPEAQVSVAAFRDTVFPGRVDLIGNAVDEHTRTLKVRVQVKNEQGKLKPGMFANVEILFPSGEQITVLPQEAVVSDEGKSFVFGHWKDDLWIRRDVKTGRRQGGYVEILEGIDRGSRVVTGGAFMLKSDILRGKMGAGCAD